MFDFQSKNLAGERLEEMEKFMAFWLGPREPEFGEPGAALAAVRLPGPLRRFYAFAGRWPANEVHPHARGAFRNQDRLASVSTLEQSDDGKLVFVVENQGNWVCATLLEGEDPPVWVSNPEETSATGRWSLVTDSLSRFLAVFVLRECIFGARAALCDEKGAARFEQARDGGTGVHLIASGPYPSEDREERFWLWGSSVLAGEIGGQIWLAANGPDGMAALQVGETGGGKAVRVAFSLPEDWDLSIFPDGSAEIGVEVESGSNARIPPGTFDFSRVEDFVARLAVKDWREGDFPVLVFRSGKDTTPAAFLRDETAVRDLFKKALSSVFEKGRDFEARLELQPPFP